MVPLLRLVDDDHTCVVVIQGLRGAQEPREILVLVGSG